MTNWLKTTATAVVLAALTFGLTSAAWADTPVFYQDSEDANLWHIANLAGLKEFRDSVNNKVSYANKTIKIDADIDLTNDGYWESIKAYPGSYLSGATIDGDGHKITGMAIVTPDPETGYSYGGGFIDKTAGALTVANLKFVNATVTAPSGSQVGVVVGMTYGNVTLNNVDLENCVVTGITKTGALVGQNDEGTVALTDCDLVNTKVYANYSGALMIGLLNTNSYGAQFVNCTADSDSKFVWITGEDFTEKGGVVINGRTYAIAGSNLWLTDPGADCWAEQRITGATYTYNDTVYNLKGSAFWPNYAAQIGEVKYETLEAALTAAQDGDTIELLADIKLSGTEQVAINKVGTYVIDGKGHTISPATDSAYVYQRFKFGESGQAYDTTRNYTLKNLTIAGFGNSTYFVRSEGCCVTFTDCVIRDNALASQANSRLMLNTHADFTLDGCLIKDNTSADSLIDFNSNASGNGTNALSVNNCLFEGNVNGGVAVIQIAEDRSVVVTDSTFDGNIVNASNNGAVVYFGDVGGDCTGCLFKDNIINYTTTSGYDDRVRVAGAIFTWAYGDNPGTISGNAFVNNSVAKQNANFLTCYAKAIYSGGYYNPQDLAGNYFGGSAPVIGQADKSTANNDIYAEYSSKAITASTYAESYAVNENGRGVTVTLYVPPVAQVVRNNAVVSSHETLAAAIAAATTGDTLKMLSDVDENVTLKNWKNNAITFDLGGYTLTGQIIAPYGAKSDGIVIKNGNIVGRDSSGFYCLQFGYGSGNATLENLSVTQVSQNYRSYAVYFQQTDKSVALRNVTLDGRFYTANSGSTIAIESGVYKNSTGLSSAQIENKGIVSATGGTFYYNPTTPNNLLAHGYVATETTDSENVQCWIVGRGPSFATVTLADSTVTEYWDLDEAIAGLAEGATLTIKPGTYDFGNSSYSLPKNVTIVGVEENDTRVKITSKPTFNSANGLTIENIDFDGGYSWTPAVTVHGDATFKNCTITGENAIYYSTVNGTLTFDGCTLHGDTYGLNVGEGTGDVVIKDCEISGWTSFGNVGKTTITGTTFSDGDYNYLRFYQDAVIVDCTFNPEMEININTTGKKLLVIDSAFEDGTSVASVVGEGEDDSPIANNYVAVGTDVVLNEDGAITGGLFDIVNEALVAEGYAVCAGPNGKLRVGIPVAQIGDVKYVSFAEAIAAADAAVAAGEEDPAIAVLDATAEQSNPNWKIDNGYLVRKVYVAQIGNVKYESLADAFAAVVDGDTITMLANSTEAAEPMLKTNGGVTLDLNGKTVTANDDIWVKTGSLTVVGSAGSAINSTGYAFYVSTQSIANNVATLTINSNDVTIHGDGYGIAVMSGGVVNLQAGSVTSTAHAAICNNGSNKANTTINITGGTVSSDSTAIYHPGPGTLTVGLSSCDGDDGHSHPVIAGKTGVEMRAGTLNVYCGDITATATEFAENANDSGSTIAGAAIAVSQHTTDKKISVNISGGVLNGIYGVYEKDLQNPETGADVEIVVTGGEISGTTSSIVISDIDGTTESVSAAISGGYFSTKVPAGYCATGYVPTTKPAANGLYTVTTPATVTFAKGDTELDVTLPDSFQYPSGDLAEVALKLPTYEFEEYTFGGWKLGNQVVAALPAGTTGDVTLVATWTKATPVTVAITVPEEVDPTETKNVEVKVTEEWVKNNVGEEATTAQIQTALTTQAENGLTGLENYLLGLDGTDTTAKVKVNSEQGTTTAMPVKNTIAEKVQTADTGFKVQYSLDEVTEAGDAKAGGEGTKQETSDLSLDLEEATSGETTVSYYKMTATITKTVTTGNTETEVEVSTVKSENTIGVVAVKDAPATTIIGVPWKSLEDGGNIKLDNLVRTANLTPGDTMTAYDSTTKTYSMWELQETENGEKEWVPSTTVTPGSSTTSDEASEVSMARGSGVWLTRQKPEEPIYLVGQVADSAEPTPLEKPEAGKQTWNIVASPSVEPVDVAELLEGKEDTDQVMVPTAGAPKNFICIGGVWGYVSKEPVEGDPNGFRPVFVTTDTTIPACTGFFYLNGDSTAENKKINWNTNSNN